jgi:hypothetical protein
MGTYDAAMANLDRAMLNWRRPRPWRSKEESVAIKGLVWLWFGHVGPGRKRESIHSLSRVLGVSRSYIQKLIRNFERTDMREADRRRSPATIKELIRGQEYTQRMRERGELRLSRASTYPSRSS